MPQKTPRGSARLLQAIVVVASAAGAALIALSGDEEGATRSPAALQAEAATRALVEARTLEHLRRPH